MDSYNYGCIYIYICIYLCIYVPSFGLIIVAVTFLITAREPPSRQVKKAHGALYVLSQWLDGIFRNVLGMCGLGLRVCSV